MLQHVGERQVIFSLILKAAISKKGSTVSSRKNTEIPEICHHLTAVIPERFSMTHQMKITIKKSIQTWHITQIHH